MPHCPKCGAEYADDRDECIDCGEPLVDEWPEDDETEDPKPQAQFVALRSYPSRVYA